MANGDRINAVKDKIIQDVTEGKFYDVNPDSTEATSSCRLNANPGLYSSIILLTLADLRIEIFPLTPILRHSPDW